MCAERLLHRDSVYASHTNPSELHHAIVNARLVTGFKCKQVVASLFHRGADYTLENFFVKGQLQQTIKLLCIENLQLTMFKGAQLA